ncbi:O-antigen polymerase [Bacillus smithii]|uniref:O-antigen polymerase n=1 Tax=Bacillus smithii TaxID=1479 RepID=UPI003D1BD996
MTFAYITSMLFYLAFALTIGMSTARRDFLNPLNIFIVYFSLTFFLLPAFQIENEDFRYRVGYSEYAYFYGWLYLNVFISIVIITYLIITNKVDVPIAGEVFDVRRWDKEDKKVTNILRIFVLIPNIFTTLYFYKYILLNGYSNYLANRIILLSGKGYYISIILALIPFALNEMVNLYQKSYLYKKKSNGWLLLFLLIIALIPGIVLGSRTNLILPLLLIILSYIHIKNKGALLSIKKFGIFSGVMVMLIYFALWLEEYRQSLMIGTKIVESKGLLIKLAGGFGTAENIYWWFDYANGKIFYGSTLLPILVGFVPRSLWENKPFGGGPAFTNTIRPGSYNQGAENISSLTTGFPFEFMMNFGFIGAVVGGMVFGGFLAFVYCYRKRIRNSIQYSIWMILLYSTMMYLHSEVFGATSKLVGLLMPLLMSQIFSKLSRKDRPQ